MQTFEMYFVHEQLALIVYIFIVLKFFVFFNICAIMLLIELFQALM